MLYGKGYMINARWKDNRRFYNVWAGMLRRCFDVKHNRYKSTFSVSDDWLCFDKFIEDSKTLDGWDEVKFNEGLIQLDKDFKQFDDDLKTYSKETCVWLSKEMNNSLQSSQCKRFKAISPDGVEHVYVNQHECARNHDLSVTLINKCLKGVRKSHKNWKFIYIEPATTS